MPLGGDSVPETWWPRTGASGNLLRARYDDAASTYRFKDIRPGRYLVGAVIGHGPAHGLAAVTVGHRMLEHDVRIDLPDVRPHVVAYVLGPDGEPLPMRGLRLDIAFDGPRGGLSGGGSVLRRPDGAYVVLPGRHTPRPGTDLDPDGQGHYRLIAHHRRLGRLEVPFAPTSQEPVTLRFRDPCMLEVEMPGLMARRAGGRFALYLKSHVPRSTMSISSRPASQDGTTFTFAGVQPGRWKLALVWLPEAARRSGSYVVVDVRDVAVDEGGSRISWALPSLHTLTVHPPPDQERVRLGLVRTTDQGAWMTQFASSEPSGPAVFRQLLPGRYLLEGTVGGERRSIAVQIPADGSVRLGE